MSKKNVIWIGIFIVVFGAADVLAQNGSESVADILKELTDSLPKPVEPVDGVLVSEPAAMEAAAEIASSAETALPADPPKIKRDRLFKVKVERERRIAETDAIQEVECAWNGMIFRDYALPGEVIEALGVSDATNAVDVRNEFREIEFDPESFATWRPALNRLFVQNTPENMERLEALLSSMGDLNGGNPTQVEIETRFVEFAEGALEELGFEWSSGDVTDLGGDWLINDESSLAETGAQTLFADSLRSVPFIRSSDQRSQGNWGQIPVEGAGTVNRIEDAFGTEASSMTLAMDFGDRFEVLVRALEQSSGVDVLSAPRVVTLSGEKASIVVGESHTFPETYEEGVSAGTLLHVKYEDFNEKILGVEMDVTPLVDGDEIMLKMNPKITDLVGWEEFLLAPADSAYTYYQQGVGNVFEHPPITALLPVFKRREIQTEISVHSGSTVGMGGLISEKIEAFDDRVPVLGSIPLLGRLFRSEGERVVKRNLMIFVTATKVAPNGRMVAGRSFE